MATDTSCGQALGGPLNAALNLRGPGLSQAESPSSSQSRRRSCRARRTAYWGEGAAEGHRAWHSPIMGHRAWHGPTMGHRAWTRPNHGAQSMARPNHRAQSMARPNHGAQSMGTAQSRGTEHGTAQPRGTEHGTAQPQADIHLSLGESEEHFTAERRNGKGIPAELTP